MPPPPLLFPPQTQNQSVYLSGVVWWSKSLGPLIDGAEEGNGGSVLPIFFSLRVNWGPSAPATRRILYRKTRIVFQKSKCKVINVWNGKSDTFWNNFFCGAQKIFQSFILLFWFGCFYLDVPNFVSQTKAELTKFLYEKSSLWGYKLAPKKRVP